MRYQTFGRLTGLRVSEYALGAANFATSDAGAGPVPVPRARGRSSRPSSAPAVPRSTRPTSTRTDRPKPCSVGYSVANATTSW